MASGGVSAFYKKKYAMDGYCFVFWSGVCREEIELERSQIMKTRELMEDPD